MGGDSKKAISCLALRVSVQGFGEDGEEFVVGELDGVAFHAAGLSGFGGGLGEVGFGEAEVAQAGEVEGGTEIVGPGDGVRGFGVGIVGEEAGDLVVAGQGGGIGGAVLEGADVGLGYMRQELAADDAVGNVDHATKGAGETVDGAQLGVGQGQTTEETGEGHVLAGGGVIAIVEGAAQGAGGRVIG